MKNDHLTHFEETIADAIVAIQQPRTDFELMHFVVGQHDTEPRRYAQCVLEIELKIQSLRRVGIRLRQMERRVSRLLRRGSASACDSAALLRIDIEDQRLAAIGALRELRALVAIFASFPKRYSREELNASEADYWRARLLRQAATDIVASGRVGIGNQDALRQIGLPLSPSSDYVSTVERRFLGESNPKIVVVVPTLIPRDEIRKNGLRCLDGWEIPGTFQRAVFVVDGRSVADAYTIGVQWALQQDADLILCVEDDQRIPEGAFDRLWHLFVETGPKSIVGAWYPQRTEPRVGAPIVLTNGRRSFLNDDGGVHEVYSIPQGFTLIPVQVFHDLPQPWFVTTNCLSQDSFFSQLARDAGYRLLVDTSIRCCHVDRETGRVYE